MFSKIIEYKIPSDVGINIITATKPINIAKLQFPAVTATNTIANTRSATRISGIE
jgi:hypothetical protein